MSVNDLEPNLDLIGIGFGPSNLALAVALAEAPAARRLDFRFIERQAEFHWHRDMLIGGSTVQISFLKDLATLRDPTSPFTFVNYLHAKGRLESFINLKQNCPTREEYTDYFRWAADAFDDRVAYGETVESVEPVNRHGLVQRLRVVSRRADGATRERLTRDLVVGVGGRPHVPAPFDGLSRERVVHTSGYVSAAERLIAGAARPMRVAVVGGGQSGAEVFHDVAERFPHAEATLILRDHALRPADDSPFVNEVFDPGFVDVLHAMPDERRKSVIASMRNTNYSVVDLDLIQNIYGLLYRQQVSGVERHRVLTGRTVEAARGGDAVELLLRDALTGEATAESFDAVILATGYRYDAHERLLAGLAGDLDGFEVDRLYRVKTPPNYAARVYLQGCNEHSHGLSDTLLSILPVRASEIVEDLCAGSALSSRSVASVV